MEYLSAEELKTMSLEGLIAYKSLLTHIGNLDDFSMGDIDVNIGIAKDLIVENLAGAINSYDPGSGSKEMLTALIPQTKNVSFLDGVLDELRKARENQAQTDKESSIASQKEANLEMFKLLYLEMTYPMPEVVRTLGRRVLDILDKDVATKLVLDKEMLGQFASKESREVPKSRARGTIEIEH